MGKADEPEKMTIVDNKNKGSVRLVVLPLITFTDFQNGIVGIE
jgi:hypothetical protein